MKRHQIGRAIVSRRPRPIRAIVGRRPRPIRAIVTAGLLAIAGCGPTNPHPGAREIPASPIPAVSGHLLRPLWQRALGYDLVVDDGLVLSLSGSAEVSAASAVTGSARWTVKAPLGLRAFGLVPGNGIVILEAGHLYGPMGAPGVTEYVVLDLATGRRLWMADAPWHFQNPPIAISGNRVVTTDLTGAITARFATTGRVLWRRPPPSGCWRRGPGPLSNAFALAADQTRVAASFSCDGYRALVQLLDPRTGAMSWRWEPPRSVGAQTDIAATGVANQGNVVVLTGQVAPPAGPYPFARTIPRSYSWPGRLGPADDIQAVLALDAHTGRPRWIELGGQSVSFTLADGAVCESVSAGMECRDDITGAPTGPVLISGQGVNSIAPMAANGSAGISGSVAAMTVAPFQVGHVIVELDPIRGDKPLGQAEVGTGTSLATANHATEQPLVVAAGTLPDGHALLLLRRVDMPTYPLVALEVTD